MIDFGRDSTGRALYIPEVRSVHAGRSRLMLHVLVVLALCRARRATGTKDGHLQGKIR
jgi:hypothetical protein